MKYLKSRDRLLLEKHFVSILYHGSPYKFKDFKNKITFFSETERFAIDYSDQKSFDYALDREPNVYKVKVNTELFDITNKEDYEKMKNGLPARPEYTYNNFGFNAAVDKDDFLLNMTGYDIEDVYVPIETAEIGDEIPNPEYKSESYLVYKKDDEYTYTISMKYYNSYIENIFKDKFDLNFGSDRKFLEPFEPIRKYVKDYIVKTTGETYVPYGLTHAFVGKFNTGKSMYGDIPDISKEDQKTYDTLLKQGKEDLKKAMIEDGRFKKFTRVPKKYELGDTWRYYENDTVQKIIKDLGYGGYVAKENKVKTYAIFNPKSDTEILSFEFPQGYEYKTIEDYNKHMEFSNSVYKELKEKSDKATIFYNRYDIFKYFKNGSSVDDTVQYLIKKEV